MEKSNFTLPELKAWDPVEARNFVLKMLDDKIRIIKSALNVIEELQVRLIVCLLFIMLSGIAFCTCILLYNYFTS
jgi:hypothetical protein